MWRVFTRHLLENVIKIVQSPFFHDCSFLFHFLFMRDCAFLGASSGHYLLQAPSLQGRDRKERQREGRIKLYTDIFKPRKADYNKSALI